MDKAPIMSTIIAIGLIPIAFLYVHAFLSGRKKRKFHAVSGFLAISGDLILSIGYMIYRTVGGKAGGSQIDLSGGIILYFALHGIISMVVIVLEIVTLITGILQLRRRVKSNTHVRAAKILFPLWWMAFLSGELVYVVYYLL